MNAITSLFTAHQSLPFTAQAYADGEFQLSQAGVEAANSRHVTFFIQDSEGEPIPRASVKVGRISRCITNEDGWCERYVLCDGKLKEVIVTTRYGLMRKSFWAPRRGSWVCRKPTSFTYKVPKQPDNE